MFKVYSKTLFFIAILTMLCFLPETSWAAEGSIFEIISSKMIETVKDVRKIVYIIAGFGLIMFAVLAIFNKISFKHLSYICIGLFLLSVMMPFINYFSGANLTDPELNYGMLIDPDNPTVVGSEIGGTSGLGGLEKWVDPGLGDMAGIPGLGSGGLSEGALGQLAEQLGVPNLSGTTIDESTPCDGEKFITANGKMKCCKNGINNSGTGCKVTFGDVVGGLKAGAGVVQDALKAGSNIKDAIEDAIESPGNALDSFKGGGDLLDRMGKLAGTLGKSADDVGSSFNNALSAAQDFTQDLGDTSRNFSGGENEFSQKIDDKDSNFNQWADKTKEKSQNLRDNLNNGVVSPGEGLGTVGDHLDGIKDTFDNFF